MVKTRMIKVGAFAPSAFGPLRATAPTLIRVPDAALLFPVRFNNRPKRLPSPANERRSLGASRRLNPPLSPDRTQTIAGEEG